MQRAIRQILCLLVFSLVINTGGIALVKTYPALHLIDPPQHTPLKSPQRPQRGSVASSDPVADVLCPVAFRQVAGVQAAQQCSYRKKDGQLPVIIHPVFRQTHFLRSQFYPDTLSPPPRLAFSA